MHVSNPKPNLTIYYRFSLHREGTKKQWYRWPTLIAVGAKCQVRAPTVQVSSMGHHHNISILVTFTVSGWGVFIHIATQGRQSLLVFGNRHHIFCRMLHLNSHSCKTRLEVIATMLCCTHSTCRDGIGAAGTQVSRAIHKTFLHTCMGVRLPFGQQILQEQWLDWLTQHFSHHPCQASGIYRWCVVAGLQSLRSDVQMGAVVTRPTYTYMYHACWEVRVMQRLNRPNVMVKRCDYPYPWSLHYTREALEMCYCICSYHSFSVLPRKCWYSGVHTVGLPS